VNRRQLMTGGLAALVAALAPRLAHAADDLRLVVFWNAGGWDTTYVFDPHAGSSVIQGDPGATVATAGGVSFADSAERPSVRGFFEDHGADTAVINGLAVGSISHTACTQLFLTGVRQSDAPDLASRVAARVPGDAVVPYLALTGPRMPGPHGAKLLPDSDATFALLQASVQDPNEAAVQAYLSGIDVGDGARAQAWREGLERLPSLQDNADVLNAEGPGDPGQAALRKAIAALDADLCRCLIVQASVPPLTQLDSHVNNHDNQSRALERSFQDLRLLCDALRDAGTLDRTLILAASEMGRTPVLNGANGKDHWPYTSAMLVGGGIAGGRTLGATSDALAGRGVDRASGEADDSAARLTPADLAGTVLARFGIDPQDELPGCAPLTALL
jgi:uncharacterized protein (DUF1501 family)